MELNDARALAELARAISHSSYSHVQRQMEKRYRVMRRAPQYPCSINGHKITDPTELKITE